MTTIIYSLLIIAGIFILIKYYKWILLLGLIFAICYSYQYFSKASEKVVEQVVEVPKPIAIEIKNNDNTIATKANADIKNLHPSMNIVINEVIKAYNEYNVDPVITSGNDSRHSFNSKHYKNKALDFRTKDLPYYAKNRIARTVAYNLGRDYYVQLESLGSNNEHLHVQYNK